MSEFETTPAEEGFEPSGNEPTGEPEWRPSQEEWDGLLSHVAAQEQAAEYEDQRYQQEAYEEAIRDAFDPYSENFNPEAALQMISALVEQQTAPIQQALAEREYQDSLAEAEDVVDDIFDELEVPEEQRDAVRTDANERLTGAALEIVLGQVGHSPESVARAAQSPDPVARQWAADMMRWADSGVGELIAGNDEAARIALSEAASQARLTNSGPRDEASVMARYFPPQAERPSSRAGELSEWQRALVKGV